jgi:hypothetical protein
LLSTGPKTAAGKTRAKMNGLKHGERSAERIATRRELIAALRALRNCDHGQTGILDGMTQADVWVYRIADELEQ